MNMRLPAWIPISEVVRSHPSGFPQFRCEQKAVALVALNCIQRGNSTVDFPSRARSITLYFDDCIGISSSIDLRSAHVESHGQHRRNVRRAWIPRIGTVWQPGIAQFTGRCEARWSSCQLDGLHNRSSSISSALSGVGAQFEQRRWTHIRSRGERSPPSTSTTTGAPSGGTIPAARNFDGPPLRRIPVSSRRTCHRLRAARIPRRHRHHQRMVVVDALAVPVRGRGLEVDGETEGLVPEDDGVG